jgi:hypothetical protein
LELAHLPERGGDPEFDFVLTGFRTNWMNEPSTQTQESAMPVEGVPPVVEGMVIRTARETVVLCAVGSGLLGLAAGFVLWDTWGHKEGEYVLPFHLAKDSLFTSFVVGLCLFGGVGCSIAFAYQSLFPYLLIFGDEVMQVVRMGIFGRTVTTQIPYANIARVTCAPEEYGFRQLQVGIDLRRPVAPATYARRNDFNKTDENTRDVYLPTFFTAGAEEIARLIAERRKKDIPATGG